MKLVAKLENEIEIREVPTELFVQLSAKDAKTIFDDTQYFFRPKDYYSPEDENKITALKKNMGTPIRLNLGAFKGEELIGWSWGVQESSEIFYMVNSAVLPQHRGKGVYGRLARAIISEVSKLGFQIIYSKHVATNNAVLIPKLKAGFTISSFEVSDQYGVLVHLRWYTNSTRRKMMDFRAGGTGFDTEIKKIIRL